MQNYLGRSEFEFTETQDWFSGNISYWRSLFAQISSPSPRALEIGSWEGRSAVFTLLELCKERGSLVCIDHFDSFQTEAGRERFRKLTHNLQATRRPHRIIPQFSVPGLIQLIQEAVNDAHPGFDWLYIDGSHEASDTFLDGELAWRLARKNAIIVFDDYRWGNYPSDSPHHPKRGVDSFMNVHRGEYEVISGTKDNEYQMVLRKTIDMNIGFTFSDDNILFQISQTPGKDSLLNLALATDSVYAMPTAVAISTAVKYTSGPINIYILDCGLTSSDRDRLIASLPNDRSDVKLEFLELPDVSLTVELGIAWSKIDLIEALPVERALYLDSDTMVRKDLRPLWSLDLGANLVAAAPDVGHPFGRQSKESLERFMYFNAGVILLDLARIRATNTDLNEAARNMKDSYFKDQDALNHVFRTEWFKLSLGWNASGMGTYADIPTPERATLKLSELADPCIVHFTGPVHPPMEHVINPWVQPYVAKPWGYAGAPGHPHAREWWEALKETGWRDWKASLEYKDMRKTEGDKARNYGLEKFEEKLRAAHGE
ncbi:glycosyltransferase family 8 protein [Ceratobasidium sp. AG-Ba]|nr:glycosyltransferase family 8 protein [Ceratobasidium sp. AG-Ba]